MVGDCRGGNGRNGGRAASEAGTALRRPVYAAAPSRMDSGRVGAMLVGVVLLAALLTDLTPMLSTLPPPGYPGVVMPPEARPWCAISGVTKPGRVYPGLLADAPGVPRISWPSSELNVVG